MIRMTILALMCVIILAIGMAEAILIETIDKKYNDEKVFFIITALTSAIKIFSIIILNFLFYSLAFNNTGWEDNLDKLKVIRVISIIILISYIVWYVYSIKMLNEFKDISKGRKFELLGFREFINIITMLQVSLTGLLSRVAVKNPIIKTENIAHINYCNSILIVIFAIAFMTVAIRFIKAKIARQKKLSNMG